MKVAVVFLAVLSVFMVGSGLKGLYEKRAMQKSLISLIPNQHTEESQRMALNESLVSLIPSKTTEQPHRVNRSGSLLGMVRDTKQKEALRDSLYSMVKDAEQEIALKNSLLKMIPDAKLATSDKFLWAANSVGNMTQISLDTLKPVKTTQAPYFVTSMAVSNDKKTLITLGSFGAIDFLDAQTGEHKQSVTGMDDTNGGYLELTKDNKFFLKAGYPGKVKQYAFPSGKLVKDYGQVFEAKESPMNTSAIWTIKATPDSQYFFVSNEFAHLKQFKLSDYSLVKDYGVVHSDSLSAMTVTADGKWLYTSSISGELKKWDIAKQIVVKDFGKIYDKKSDWIFAVTSTADSKQVFVTSSNWTLGLMSSWSVDTDKMSHDYKTVFPNHSFRSVITSSDNKYVFTGSDRGFLKVYEVDTGKLVKDFGEVFASENLDSGIYTLALA